MSIDDYLTIPKFAKAVRKNAETVRRMVKAGKLEYAIICGTVGVHKDEIEKVLKGGMK